MTNIDKPYIEGRVQDWIRRIEQVYDRVKEVASSNPDITCEVSGYTKMFEELMSKNDVEAHDAPVLSVKKSSSLVAKFKPVGLWVIGANGRIDILTGKGSYILVDLASSGAESKWTVYPPESRTAGEVFDSQFIARILGAQ